jgi:serine/threonine-protein kinase
MGSVWVAEHLVLRSKVAIKLIDASLRDNPEWSARFIREARAAAALRSSHVVQILDYGIDRGMPYMVMELLEGENLSTRLMRQGSLSAQELLVVMKHLGKAMTKAHQAGIIHRDLKPENIFLVDEGEEFIVKVLDFGVAKALHAPAEPGGFQTEAGTFLGTPQYTCPEQTRGEPVDARADLWAMAVVAFECLTGRRPFEGNNMGQLIAKICREPVVVPSSVAPVPAGFDAWFLRATQRDPEERFQTARELVDALREVLEPVRAAPVSGSSVAESQPGGLPGRPLQVYSPSKSAERRSDVRRPSSVPAGINGARDLKHVALIQNISRTGALLCTRLSCVVGSELTLNLHATERDSGQSVRARVVRVEPLSQEQTRLWRYDVGVEFVVILPHNLLEALAIDAPSGARRLSPPTPQP